MKKTFTFLTMLFFLTASLFIIALAIFALTQFASPTSSEYQQAEAFLKEHISFNGSIETTLVDNNGKRVHFSPYNYPSLYDALPVLDSLRKTANTFIIRKNDSDQVSPDFLRKHILSSLEVKAKSPFARHLSFSEYCEYVLPYRAGKEPFTDYMENLSPSFRCSETTFIKYVE